MVVTRSDGIPFSERQIDGFKAHKNNIFIEGELVREATVAKFATVQNEGERSVLREIDYYNLGIIISVGYRVNHRKALSSDNGQTG